MDKIINKSLEYNIKSNAQGIGSQSKTRVSMHSKDTLEDPFRFERLLAELSTKFIDLPPDQFDKEIEAGLKSIVEYLGIDRGSLSEFSDDGKSLIVTHAYSAPEDKIPLAKSMHLKVPFYTAMLSKGEHVVLSWTDIPKEWVLERAYGEEAGIKSNLGLPLKVGGKILGALTFDALHSDMNWSETLIRRISIFAEIFGNALERKRTSIQIKQEMAFQALLSRISTRFLRLAARKIDASIEKSLQQIVEFFGVDRSTVFQYNENKNIYYITHVWARKGIPEIQGKLTDKDFPWMANKLKQGITFSSSRIDELPADAAKDKKRIQGLGNKSLMVIPMMAMGKMIGAISLDALRYEKTWPENIQQRAKLIGDIFSNILRRKDSELRLLNAFSEIKRLKSQIESDYNYLREEIDSEHDFHEIIGDSAQLKHVLFKINQVAPTDTTVLILGETGTGKELVARAVHNRSPRKDRPMVRVNCAALSPTLIESELFGHVKGAFTGAHTRKLGRFETAHGSSFFLDEIGELPIELQAKLLRVIQDGEFERMGSSRTIKVDVRIIAATNKDLDDQVRKGLFRQDLLFRLNVFPITMPPLRTRKDDLPLLVSWFVQVYGKRLGKDIKRIPEKIMADLQNYKWPGNVRELENTIERAVINTQGPTLQLLDIPGATCYNQTLNKQKEAPVNMGDKIASMAKTTLPEMEHLFTEMSKNYIIQVLEETNWRISGPKGAGLILGLKPSTLHSRMKKLNIQKKSSLK